MMNIPFNVGVIALLFALVTPTLQASSERTGLCTKPAAIDEKQLVAMSLECAPSIEAFKNTLKAANYDVDVAGRFAEPRLGISVAPETYGLDQVDDGYQLEFTQTLPWPGERSLEKSLAKSGVEKQKARLRYEQIRVAEQVKQAYAHWQYAIALQAISRQQLIILEQITEQLVARYRSGHSPRSALLQARQRLLQLRRDTDAIEVQVEQRRLELSAVSGVHGIYPSEAAEASLLGPAEMYLNAGLDQLDQHPELLLLKSAQFDVDYRLAQEKKDRLPDVSLVARYNTLWEDEDKRWMIGVGMNLPLDFRKRRAKENSLSAQADALRWQQRDRRLQIETAIRQRYLSWQELADTYQLYSRELLPLAEEQLEASLSDYRAGAIDFQSLLIAQQEVLATKTRYAAAQRDLVTSRADFIAAAGLIYFEELTP